MAHINVAQLLMSANALHRVLEVQKDPAVQKSWAEVRSDAAQLLRSTSVAVSETSSAWRRTADSGDAGPIGQPA